MRYSSDGELLMSKPPPPNQSIGGISEVHAQRNRTSGIYAWFYEDSARERGESLDHVRTE